MPNDPYKNPFESWHRQRCHPNAPAGGGGSGNFTSAGPLGSGDLGRESLPHPNSPAGRYLTHQEIRTPALHERVEYVVKAYFLALRLAPGAVYQETGYQLGQVIEALLPGLLQMLAVLGISVVAGAGVGAAIGFFLGGVNAAPGAVVGAELGLEIGTAVLAWMGLGFLAVAIGQGMGELTGVLTHAIRRAWHAAERHHPQFETERAAEGLAQAVGILFRLILQGLLAYVLKKGAVNSSRAALSTAQTISRGDAGAAADASLAEVSALLQQSKLPDGFVVWLERNWDDLKRNPKLSKQKTADTGNTAIGNSTTSTPSQLQMAKENLSKGTVAADQAADTKKISSAPKNPSLDTNGIKVKRGTTKNGYDYEFDELGRVKKVDGHLKLNKSQGRNSKAQLKAGGPDRLPDDQGGHFIGRRFDGPMDDFNHFAQNGNFNNGAYKSLENSWQRALDEGKSVKVEITPSYTESSLRPDTIRVRQWIDGIPKRPITFGNNPGGKL